MTYSRVEFSVARPEMDHDLREFMGSQPSEGRMRIGLAEDPSYFAAQKVRGSRIITVVGRDTASDQIAAVGSLAFRDVYFNGQRDQIGYLNSLRIAPGFRRGTTLARGFRHLGKERSGDTASCYLTTILEDNREALAILAGGRRGIPRYFDWGRYLTLAFSRTARKTVPNDKSISTSMLRDQDWGEWSTFLRQNGPRRQFFPFTSDEISRSIGCHWPGLKPENILIARSNGKIVGTLAVWDQRSLRRWTVHGYSGILRWTRPLVSSWMQVRKKPGLPKNGELLDHRFLSLVCIENDNPDVFSSLLHGALKSLESNETVLMIGLHERDPLLSCLRRVPKYEIHSRLYRVSWEGDRDSIELSDGRIPYLDVGTL